MNKKSQNNGIKILIAPDKFKDSLSALQVCESIKKGLQKANSSLIAISHPLADGGEDSIKIINKKGGLKRIELNVHDPLNRTIAAHYYLSEKVAFIELATASGLMLLAQKERNPMFTSTIGTGELIVDAISKGATEINLFVGGSATNDGGMGIAHALGFRFYDKHKQELKPIGKNLTQVHRILNIKKDFTQVKINVLTDVLNPLLGKQGAAHIYAAQKGANKNEINKLHIGLKNLANIIYKKFDNTQKRMGAAGGVGLSLVGLMHAQLKSGVDFIMEWTDFEEQVRTCDMVISGEGHLDTQSLQGKVVSKVAALAKQYQKPFILFVGQSSLTHAQKQKLQVNHLDTILAHAKDEQDSFAQAASHLQEMSARFAQEFLFLRK